MNIEKIAYSLMGSLIVGSVIQKNMGLEQQYFFILSVVFWVICVVIQWWNYKREQLIRDKFENSDLEKRDAIVNKILELISEINEREIVCIKEEFGKLAERQTNININLIESIDKVYGLIQSLNGRVDTLSNTEVTKFDEMVSVYKAISSDLQITVNEVEKKLTELSQINKKIMDIVPIAITKSEEDIISRIEKESNVRKEYIEDKIAGTTSLFNTMVELNNSIVGNIKAIENVSVNNKDCLCAEITSLKEMVDVNQRDAIVEFGKVTDKLSEDICSQLIVQSNSVQGLITEKFEFVSNQNEILVSTMEMGTENVVNQIIELKDKLEYSKKSVNGTIADVKDTVLDKLSELMRLLNTIHEESKDDLQNQFNDLHGIFSNLQTELENTNGNLSEIKNINELLEEAKNKLQEIESAIGAGTEEIESAVSQGMEEQNKIVAEEQNILESYNVVATNLN